VQEIAEVLEVPPSSVEEGLAALGTRLESTGSGLVLRRSPAGGASTPGPTCIPTWNGSPREPLPPVSAGPRWRPLPWWPTASRFPAPRSRRFAGGFRARPAHPGAAGPGRGGRPGRGPGQAALYGTTGLFLEKLGLRSRAELPPLADHVPPPGSWSGWRSLSGRRSHRATSTTDRARRAGLPASREEMIQAGRVTVDGRPAHLGQKVDPDTARVEVDGIPLPSARTWSITCCSSRPAW